MSGVHVRFLYLDNVVDGKMRDVFSNIIAGSASRTQLIANRRDNIRSPSAISLPAKRPCYFQPLNLIACLLPAISILDVGGYNPAKVGNTYEHPVLLNIFFVYTIKNANASDHLKSLTYDDSKQLRCSFDKMRFTSHSCMSTLLLCCLLSRCSNLC